MSEKICLQWNDFQDNVKSAFGNLRKSPDFADVTLACEEIEAHKIIPAASSPFFQAILKKNKHTHPLIYLRGMKSNGASPIETRESIIFEVVVSRPFKNISYVWSIAFGN